VSDSIQIPVFSHSGDPSGTVEAPGAFTSRPNTHVVYLAVVKQLANARVGTASTKTKGEVRGGGKKPWRQKHTGRARQGSFRSPQFRHGGVVFGPRPRKYAHELPAQVRRLALRSVLAGKTKAGQVAVLESLSIDPPKTKAAAALLKKMSISGRSLIVLPAGPSAAARAFRNLADARVETANTVSVYDLLNARHVVIVREALDALAARCSGGR
jgi:large subunit ribosomal protein L4